MKNKQHLKKQGQAFWNQTPCGGQWISFGDKVDWLAKTEPYILSWLRYDLLKNKTVLDLGCGQGLILSLIASRCRQAIGIDISQNSLQLAKNGFKELGIDNAKFILADAEKVPLPNDYFDTVYCIGVLHHTPDTQAGINEINRLLKNGGRAVVMLYRKYTPKWLAVATLRGMARIPDIVSSQKYWVANQLRRSKRFYNSKTGTALLELFGCPVLKTYSTRQIKTMFKQFNNTKITHAQPGFSRLPDFLPGQQRILRKACQWLDRHTLSLFGFYTIIEAQK